MVVLPVPVNVKLPSPESSPESVAEPDVRLSTVPPKLVTESGTVELSPLLKTKAPPAKTGLTVTPMLGMSTRSPEMMFVRTLPPTLELPPVPEPVLVPELPVTTKSQTPGVAATSTNVQLYEPAPLG